MAKVFNVTTSDNKKVEEFYEKALKELADFYGFEWTQNTPKIFLVPDRKTFNALYHKETEEWVVGSTMNSNNTFFVLAPDAYGSESSHKYSDEEYYKLIKHELSHFYARTFFDDYKPKWLTEGLALYSAGQLNEKWKPKKFIKFLDFFSNGGPGLYDESGFAVEVLIKQLGKEKILEILKGIKIPVDEKEFKEYFEHSLNIDLTYDWFNERL